MTLLEVTDSNEETFGIFNISCGGVESIPYAGQIFKNLSPHSSTAPKTLTCGWGSMVLGELFFEGAMGMGRHMLLGGQSLWYEMNERSVGRR